MVIGLLSIKSSSLSLSPLSPISYSYTFAIVILRPNRFPVYTTRSSSFTSYSAYPITPIPFIIFSPLFLRHTRPQTISDSLRKNSRLFRRSKHHPRPRKHHFILCDFHFCFVTYNRWRWRVATIENPQNTGRYFRRLKAHVAYREPCLEGGCRASRFVKSDVIPVLERRSNRGARPANGALRAYRC